MKIPFKPAMLSMAMVIGFTGASAGGAYAASAQPVKPSNPDWTYKVPAGQDIESWFNKATVGGDNVYFRNEQGASSFVVQSFNQKSGDKTNWTYDFRGKAQYFMGGELEYGKNGDVYFLSKQGGENKSYTVQAVNAQGKLKWTTPVKVDISGDLSVLPNGDIVVTSHTQPTKKEKEYTIFQTLGNDGKLKSEKKITDSGTFRVLNNGQVLNSGTKMQMYPGVNALSKPIISYSLPKNHMLFYDFRVTDASPAVYPLSGGGMLMEIYEEVAAPGGKTDNNQSGTMDKRTLIAFDAKGKKTFARPLAEDESVMAAGNGFVLQKGQKFETYDIHNKRTATATLEGENLWMMTAPTGEVVVTSKKSGKLYALDAKTLKINHEVDMNIDAERTKAYSFYYAGKGSLYTLEAGEKTVSHYTLN